MLGKHDVSSEACPTVMVYLNGEKLDYSVNKSGSFLIKINQPDSSFLEREITIE
jgi:hypothetical protein